MPSAVEMMAQAAEAPRRIVRERLVILAALRSGSSLRTTADEFRCTPSLIRVWIDEGARFGWDGLQSSQRPRHYPPDTAADLAAVAAWLGSLYHPSCGFNLWTVENVTSAAERNLGIRLSPDGARSVIAAERARRRPEYYRHLARRRRRKKPPPIRRQFSWT